jgi:hypothetical protein
MSATISDKHYEKFTAKERINLAIAAMARNDHGEADRLWRTCRTYNYTARDLDYKFHFQAIVLISALFFQKCVYHYNKIQVYELLLFISDHPQYIDIVTDEKANVAEKARLAQISYLQAVHEALFQFCEQVGLDSENFPKTINLNTVCFDIQEYLAMDIEPDQEYIQNIKDEFLKYWHF